MDPKETLKLALGCIVKGTMTGDEDMLREGQEHLSNYHNWRARGGFEPTCELNGDLMASVISGLSR